jgi:hypothetical protein
VTAQAFSVDSAMITYQEGLKSRVSDFTNAIEQYSANTIGQHLEIILKLQIKCKDLENLQSQTAKERDELKIANERLIAEREEWRSTDENGAPKHVTNKRSFWEGTARAIKK